MVVERLLKVQCHVNLYVLHEFLNVTLTLFLMVGRSTEMIVPDVDKNILEELEAMGFPKARATRALHYSGKTLVCHVLLFCTFGCGFVL